MKRNERLDGLFSPRSATLTQFFSRPAEGRKHLVNELRAAGESAHDASASSVCKLGQRQIRIGQRFSSQAREENSPCRTLGGRTLESRVLLSTVITLHGGDTLTFSNEDSTPTVPVTQTVKAFWQHHRDNRRRQRRRLQPIHFGRYFPGNVRMGRNVNGGPGIPPAETLPGTPITIVLPDGADRFVPPTAIAVDPLNPNLLYGIIVHAIPPIGGAAADNEVYLYQIDKVTGVATIQADLTEPHSYILGVCRRDPHDAGERQCHRRARLHFRSRGQSLLS